MSFRALTLGIFITTAALPDPASANGVLSLDGITLLPGTLIETIDLFESERNGGPISARGQELIGIGIVNRILDSANNVLWRHGDNGRELTLHFHSYIAEDFGTQSSAGLGFDSISFTGGVVELYVDDTPDFSAAGSLADGIASATDGNLFLSLAGSPVGGFGSLSGKPVTLSSLGLRFGNVGSPFSQADALFGTGLLDVTGGLAAAFFDTNAFGCTAAAGQPCADLPFSSSGQLSRLAGSAWTYRGTGEVQASVVPVPGGLVLLGSGLVALAAHRRRRETQAAPSDLPPSPFS